MSEPARGIAAKSPHGIDWIEPATQRSNDVGAEALTRSSKTRNAVQRPPTIWISRTQKRRLALIADAMRGGIVDQFYQDCGDLASRGSLRICCSVTARKADCSQIMPES